MSRAATRSPDPRRDGDSGGEGDLTGQLPLELGHPVSHSLRDFVMGEGNRIALAHVLAYPRWPHALTVLTGPPQAGKSHLGRIWAKLAGAAAATPETLEQLASSRSRNPVLIEDLDRTPYPEPALFHLLNLGMREGRSLLMTARTPISSWPYRTEDVKSRARLGAQIIIEAAGDIELSQIFAKLFADRQVSVEAKVIEFVLPRMERSPEEAVALTDLMDRLALARGTAITRRIAAEALQFRRLSRGEEADAPAWEGEVDE